MALARSASRRRNHVPAAIEPDPPKASPGLLHAKAWQIAMIGLGTATAQLDTSVNIAFPAITRGFALSIPRASATPRTAPTIVWLVEMGSPSFEQASTVVAVANSAEKPREGVSSVSFVPIVAMTRFP